MPKRVGLTVDWDYFTEVPLPDSGNSWAFDWGMSERDDPLFGSTIWMIRYASLIQHGLLD